MLYFSNVIKFKFYKLNSNYGACEVVFDITFKDFFFLLRNQVSKIQ